MERLQLFVLMLSWNLAVEFNFLIFSVSRIFKIWYSAQKLLVKVGYHSQVTLVSLRLTEFIIIRFLLSHPPAPGNPVFLCDSVNLR